MAKNCQISTPKKYVIQMLNYAEYNQNVFGKRVLENSCGEGNVLVEIVRRYIKDARRRKISDTQIVEGLENDIIAYETDEEKILLCIKKLDKYVKEIGFYSVHWNIRNKDFLRQQIEKFDFIIGNPPYITYHDLDEENRDFLKNNFRSCKEGRFDYSYAFIEACIKSLSINGKLVYLLPYSVIKNKFADLLRKDMALYITKIYDYTGIKIFPDAITSSVILLMENKHNKKYVEYYEIIHKKKRKVLRSQLTGKWSFTERESGEERFGTHFDVCNSVATLYNKAYVLEKYSLDGDYYYVDGMPIEKKIVYPAISTKSNNKKKKEINNDTLIIFPYKINNGVINHYSEEEFEKEYPLTTKYLKKHITDLENRKSDKTAKWFEYGRTQAIGRAFGDKLVIPMVITNNVTVCHASNEMIPYAGYFVKCTQNSDMTLEQARKILESKKFYEYVKAYGTPTTPTSYRISVNDIKEFRFNRRDRDGEGTI